LEDEALVILMAGKINIPPGVDIEGDHDICQPKLSDFVLFRVDYEFLFKSESRGLAPDFVRLDMIEDNFHSVFDDLLDFFGVRCTETEKKQNEK